MSYNCISIEEAKKMIHNGDVTIVDIRDRASFASAHVDNAIHVSNENIDHVIQATDKNKPILVFCYHGNSSKSAAEYFYNQGFVQAYSVDGGVEMWKQQL